MINPVVYASLEPFIVDIVPVRTESYTLSLSIAEVFTSLANTTMTMTTATDSPTSLLTCTLNLRLQSDLNSSLEDRRSWPPTLTILTIIAMVLFGAILLSAISYFIFILFRSKFPSYPSYREKPKKWRHSDIEHATPTVVQEHLRGSDLENDGENSQLKLKKDRVKALASLEGRSSVAWPVYGEEEAKEKTKHLPKYTHVNEWPQKPSSAHIGAIAAEVRRCSKDTDETHMVGKYTGHPTIYSAYLCDLLTTRETESQHSLQGAKENTFTELCDILDLLCRDHVLQGTTDRIQGAIKVQNDIQEGLPSSSMLSVYSQGCLEKDKEMEQILEPMAYQTSSHREGNESRFNEGFGLDNT